MNKKGFITSPADLIKGFLVGFILGAAFIYLSAKGIIPVNVGLGGV